MKELSIEEKAKRYDELKVTAQGLEQDGCFDELTLFDLFPELKESDDERIKKELITFFQRFPYERIGNDCTKVKEAIAWLEKQGEQKPAWSEEDEKMYKAISIALSLKDAKRYLNTWYTTPKEADNWLKSLKDRYTWKPSDEQMQALSNAGNSFRPFEEGHKVLWSLYNDLKKLRKE